MQPPPRVISIAGLDPTRIDLSLGVIHPKSQTLGGLHGSDFCDFSNGLTQPQYPKFELHVIVLLFVLYAHRY